MEEDLPTIAGIASANPDFSILVTALEAADLVDAVDNPDDELTVFAPTNAAFAQLAADLGYTGDPEDEDAVFGFIADALATLDPDTNGIGPLTDILLYHVSPGAKIEQAFSLGNEIETLLEGATVTPDGGRLVDLEPDLLDAEIVIADVEASNGFIQAIDRVLLPLDLEGNDAPSIFDIAATTDGFSVLTLALEASGLDVVVADPDAEFTVFAPTDDAFAELAVSLGFTGDTSDPDAVFAAIADVLAGLSDDGDPIPLLTDILLYHVTLGAQSVAELQAVSGTATALADAGLVVGPDGSIFDADPEAPNAAFVEGLTDIGASNGTVQVIDRVLLPLDLADPEPTDTIADIVAASGEGFDEDAGDFDILLAALVATDLVDAFNDPESDFTVFAPTDAAFLSLAEALGVEESGEQAAFDGIVATFSELFGGEAEAIDTLAAVLQYHVLEGSFTRAELALGNPSATAEIVPLTSPATDGRGLVDSDPGFEDPEFIDAASDIVAANGIIHAIDEVLIPVNLPDATDITGTGEDDRLEVAGEIRAIDGRGGTDTAVFSGNLADASFDFITFGFSIGGAGTDGPVQTTDVELFEFDDQTVIVSTEEIPAQVFRLYAVGLGRDGDIPGVTFWSGIAESEGLDFVADAFLLSDEFAAIFGDIDPESQEIVEAFYTNFLGREADEEGLEFWTDAIAADDFDTSDLLISFSESDEFKELTANTFDDGVLLLA
ncbi:MAG: fasciclin domain-containing protein [Pikeienuella sp.]